MVRMLVLDWFAKRTSRQAWTAIGAGPDDLAIATVVDASDQRAHRYVPVAAHAAVWGTLRVHCHAVSLGADGLESGAGNMRTEADPLRCGRMDEREDRMTDHLIDRREVARRLGCSESTVKRLGIPIVKLDRLVRYEPTDVEAFKCARKQGVKPMDEQPLPPFPARKAARRSTSLVARSRSGRRTAGLARDELSEALALTARLRHSGKGSARRGTRSTRSDSATRAGRSPSPGPT